MRPTTSVFFENQSFEFHSLALVASVYAFVHGYYVYHIQNPILKKDSNAPICSAANSANEGTRTVDILTALVCSAFLAGTVALLLEIALKRPETFREMLPGARVFAEAPVEVRSVTGTGDRGSGRGVLATA